MRSLFNYVYVILVLVFCIEAYVLGTHLNGLNLLLYCALLGVYTVIRSTVVYV